MTVTVYGRPGCGKCERTRKFFDKAGVDYDYIDIDTINTHEDPNLQNTEFSTLPIVITDYGNWCDFRLDKIKGIILIEGEP